MKIQDIMTRDPRCLAPDDSLTQAASVMRDMDIGGVPICDNGRLAGMLTDRDIAIRAVAEGRDPKQTKVREAMSPGVEYVFEDQDVDDVARLFEEKQIRRAPVLNRDKKLVGIVALGDLAVDAGEGVGGEALKDISQPAEPKRSR